MTFCNKSRFDRTCLAVFQSEQPLLVRVRIVVREVPGSMRRAVLLLFRFFAPLLRLHCCFAADSLFVLRLPQTFPQHYGRRMRLFVILLFPTSMSKSRFGEDDWTCWSLSSELAFSPCSMDSPAKSCRSALLSFRLSTLMLR